MAVTYNIKGTTNPSFKIGKNGVVLSPENNTSETTLTLPNATGTVVLADATQTLTNKTLDATTISGHLTPSANVTYDLGTSSLRFRDIYLSGSTIDLGGAKLSNDGSDNLDIKDSSGNRKIIRASAIELVDSSGKKMKLERDATTGKLKKTRKNADDSDEGSSDILDIVTDTSPQLGGDLDLNSNNITGTGDVNITGNGAFSGNVTVTGNLTVNGTTTTVNSTQIDVQNAVRFEGATADEFETVLTVTDPTADRTITLPDSTGTVVLADTTDTLTNKTLTTPDVNTSLKMVSGGQLQFRDNQSHITENGGILLWNSAAGRGVRMYTNGAERVAVSYDGNLELKTGVDIIFEGATSDDFETKLTVTDPTADRTVTLPDETGTVALTSNLPSTTDDLSEGSSNLYYTDARSRAGISLSSGTPAYNNTTGVLTVPSTTDHITEGSTNLYYTDARVQAVSINEVVEDTTPQLGGDLDVNGNSITSTSNGDVDIAPHGTGNAKITSTGALILPVGTTAQRPTTPVVGMFRFNSTTDRFEGYNGASWVILGSTLPTNEATDYGATTTTAISNHDYGAITDADTITIDYEDLS